ncbi:hypothetical protein D3C76_1021710 [compost metagenome]
MLRVLLAADVEGQRAGALGELRLARFLCQRQADDGQPVVLLLDHQHRFAVKARVRCLGRGAEVNDRDATGYRLVQLTGDVAGLGAAGEHQAQQQQRGKQTGHGSVQ